MAIIKHMVGLKVISGFRGVIDFYVYMGQPCARKWPKSPGKIRSAAVMEQWVAWRYITQVWNQIDPAIQDAYRDTAQNTNLTGRDLFSKNFISASYLKLGA